MFLTDYCPKSSFRCIPLWLLFSILLAHSSNAQVEVDSVYTKKYIDKSTSFAWMTFGGDVLHLQGGTTEFIQDGLVQSTSFGASSLPRITIGGIHFWGHTDFYVTFPLSFLQLQNQPEGFDEFTYRQGIETGARIYPFKIKPNALRPFAGISFRSLIYNQKREGESYKHNAPNYERMIVPLQFGLTYATKKSLFTASAYYQFKDKFSYHISPTQTGTVKLEPLSFNLSYTKYWDGDRHARKEKAIKQFNVKHHVLKKEKRLSTWYAGIGPSGSLQRTRSPYLKNNLPHLYHDFIGGFTPDITFGRYFHRPDMNVGLSYRFMIDQLEGYDTKLQVGRHSIMAESYKFLFNWLGFVPFAGITASVENLSVKVNREHYQETKPALGIIFGWDIRVTQTDTNLLRTNLRWTPNLHLSINGDKMMFDHLEFNFIQWVHFFGRKKAYDKYRK